MGAATGMLVLFLGAIVISAFAGSIHPPSHTEIVNPDTLSVDGEFASPGVFPQPDGRVSVVIRAEFFVFRPSVVRVPAGQPVTFRISSPDVLHGFQIVGTNINLTVAPGYVSETTTTFDRPDEIRTPHPERARCRQCHVPE